MDVDKWLDMLTQHSSNSGFGDIRRLEGSFRLWRAWCPMHPEQRIQMMIDYGEDDEPAIYCNAGCDSASVVTFVKKCFIDHRRTLRRSRVVSRPAPNVLAFGKLFADRSHRRNSRVAPAVNGITDDAAATSETLRAPDTSAAVPMRARGKGAAVLPLQAPIGKRVTVGGAVVYDARHLFG